MKKIFFGIILSAFLLACNNEKKNDPTGDVVADSSSIKKPATEVLDLTEANDIKNSFTALSRGDIEAMTANYDDNVRYLWSAGDSAVGKQAVKEYWKGRWKMIDSLSFPEVIVLPIKVNESQSLQYVPVGKWVLAWTLSQVKYKNGKKITFWVHTDYYYNNAGKVASVIQYIDRYPIMEATKGMKK